MFFFGQIRIRLTMLSPCRGGFPVFRDSQVFFIILSTHGVARSFVLLLHYIITDVIGIFPGAGGTPANSWWGCAEHFSKS